MTARRLLRLVLLAACALVAGMTVTNVLLDNAVARAAGAAAACGGGRAEGADCILTASDRTPFGQSFEFTRKSGSARKVSCHAAYLVFGPFRCVPASS